MFVHFVTILYYREGAGARTPISVPGLLAQAALDAGDLRKFQIFSWSMFFLVKMLGKALFCIPNYAKPTKSPTEIYKYLLFNININIYYY